MQPLTSKKDPRSYCTCHSRVIASVSTPALSLSCSIIPVSTLIQKTQGLKLVAGMDCGAACRYFHLGTRASSLQHPGMAS